MIDFTSDGKIVFVFDRSAKEQVYLVGDFNNWDEKSHPLKRGKDDKWSIKLSLNPGEYEFKYKVGTQWYNDYDAHKYVPNAWGSDNSVIVISKK